jgi:hypothetical protein
MEAPTTNIPANSTTVELDRPENTCFAGIKPSKPLAIAPAIAVTARGISSVTKKSAMTANIMRHFTAWDIIILLKIIFAIPMASFKY